MSRPVSTVTDLALRVDLSARTEIATLDSRNPATVGFGGQVSISGPLDEDHRHWLSGEIKYLWFPLKSAAFTEPDSLKTSRLTHQRGELSLKYAGDPLGDGRLRLGTRFGLSTNYHISHHPGANTVFIRAQAGFVAGGDFRVMAYGSPDGAQLVVGADFSLMTYFTRFAGWIGGINLGASF